MLEFIKEITKKDSFFKTRKIKKIRVVEKINKNMFPSSISFNNAPKFLSDYDPNDIHEKVLLNYTITQQKKANKNRNRPAGPKRQAKGFQLYLKFSNDLYIVLDRRESAAPGAYGQLILRYMDGNGKKQSSGHFHGSELFDNLSDTYDKELLLLSLEHNISSESAEEVRNIFLF